MTTSTLTPSWYRGFIQGKTRIALAWAFAACLVVLARQYPWWPGIALCWVGAWLRARASGYLRKDSRPAVGGPYAYVRNPLYLGTYLMALGTALAIRNVWLFAGMTFAFAAIYHFIILDEETKLDRIFGAPYVLYRQLVPRFFPFTGFGAGRWPRPPRERLLEVNPELAHHEFSAELARKNKAYEAYLSFAGLMGFVAIVVFVKDHV